MKILNLYAGIGGNRKSWGDKHEITAVEIDPEIAQIYQDFYPDDEVIVEDAHEYLLNHFQEYDFIWSSPPCQTHSKMRYLASKRGSYAPRMPVLSLYSEIIFMQKFCKNNKWVVENVIPYYKPLIIPEIKIDRHLFWSNFKITAQKFSKPEIKHNKITGKSERYGINLIGKKLRHRKDQIIRNCLNPDISRHILDCAMKGGR